MAYEQKDGTGSLFKNDKKTEETHPDYNGSVLLGGVAYWQNAWINTDKNGKKYMSIKYKPKEQAAERVPGKASTPIDLEDSEIPF